MGQPQFWLWGHVLDRTGSWRAPFKDRVGNWIANRFDSDAFVLTQQGMEKLTRQIEMHPDGVLWSYVSTAYRYAQFLQEREHSIQLRGVYVAAEPLFDHQRQLIQEVLGCPVFDNYSSIDTGAIARECEQHSGLHIAARNCYVEVLRDGKPVPDGEDGEFVLTNLTNFGFPVIRYKIEDWGRKSTSSCICGRGEPMLEVVEGRVMDLFKTRDGRTVYGAFADPLMPTLGDIKQFQVVQKSLDLLVFYIVTDGSISEDKLLELEQICKGVFGENVEIKFKFVDHLPSTPTGKHRFLISEVE